MATDLYGYGNPRRPAQPTTAANNDAKNAELLAMYQAQMQQQAAQYAQMLALQRQRVRMPSPVDTTRQYAEQMRMMNDQPRGQRNVATYLYGY